MDLNIKCKYNQNENKSNKLLVQFLNFNILRIIKFKLKFHIKLHRQ